MNFHLTDRCWPLRVIAGLSIVVAILAFAFNFFLLVIVFDGKRLIDKIESGAGRKLSGYELYSNFREVNDYYYPARAMQGDILYWSSAITIPWVMAAWILVSTGCLVFLLRMAWNSHWMRAAGFGALMLMISLLSLVVSHLGLIGKIAWAID